MKFAAKLGLLLACGGVVHAQFVVSARAGMINYIQGTVYLDSERLNTAKVRHMKPDQILHTVKGNVEVLLAPAVVLRLGDDSSVWLEDTRLNDVRVAVESGSVLIEVIEMAKDFRLRVRLGATVTEFHHNGLYRFDVPPGKLRIYGGEAETLLGGMKVTAKRGQAVDLGGLLAVSDFDRKSSDSFHSWAARRSFLLFNSSAESRKQKHWTYVGDGWVRNDNFNAKYGSSAARNDNSWAELKLERGPSSKISELPHPQAPPPPPNTTGGPPPPVTPTPTLHGPGEPGGPGRGP